jgi:photosystem II stability/assembly factor-like uncharacterized protein
MPDKTGATSVHHRIIIIYSQFSFINEQTGFAAGGTMYLPFSGIILKTVNGGVNWNYINTSSLDVEFHSMEFTDANTGYAVGTYVYGSTGVIYKTTNGGNN